jgi:hypothetical protein
MQFLENVNEDLKKSVAIAAQDFVIVNYLLKNYYSSKGKEIAQLDISADTHTKIQELTSALQYMDVFSQRVYHLIITHERMANQNLAQGLLESFYHLHVFQALTIELDLLRSITIVKTLLGELRGHFVEIGKIDWMDEDLFENTHQIKEKLQTTSAALRVAGGETQHLPLPTLTEDQTRILNSLYSMESERVVLSWFLNSMPAGTMDELMHHYEMTISKLDDDNTELF